MSHAEPARVGLSSGSRSLAVCMLPPLLWSDLGTPDRVRRTLGQLGVSAPWLAGDLAE